ncbi:MAG: hypothetical protein WBB08_05430 [Halobacteriota archaeon]
MEQPKSFDGVMNNIHEGWPTFDDFKQESVFFDKENVKIVDGLLKKYRRCLIRGAEGRGKTVLSRVVGFNYYKDKWKIRFIDIREVRKENIDGICRYIDRIEDENFLFVIENAHASLEEITPKLIEIANEHHSANFIFVSRKIFPGEEQLLIGNPFEEWEEKELHLDLTPGLEVARGIINIAAKKINYKLTEQDECWIENEFGKETINLRRLKWYLDAWSEIGGPLSLVPKERVLEKVLKDFFIEELDINLRRMLLKVSGVFQFDVDFYGRDHDTAILTELVKRGVITFIGGDYYRLQHSSDAAYIIEAEAKLKARKEPGVVTTDILKAYLQRKPENYHELITALFKSKEKRILAEIFKDQKTYDAIFDMIKQDRIRVVSSVLGYLTWACGNERGLEFWSQYKKLGGDSLDEQKEKLKSKLTEASLTEVYFLLSFLNKVDYNERIWLANEVFNEEDLVQRVEDLSFSTINNLIRLLPNEKTSAILSKLGQEPLKVLGKLLDRVPQVAFVTDEDAVGKIALQIVNNITLKAQEKYDPEQLSLLVNNVKRCNELAGEQLCSRIISELNMSDYIRIPFENGSAVLVWQIYQYDGEKGKELANKIFKLDLNKLLDSSEAEAVKQLLWNLLQINESEVRSWIQNMEEKIYLSKILSASSQEAFWHLWNLYQINEEKGKSVAQSLANNLLSGITAIETKDIPLLGFFVFCNIKLDLNIPIPSPGEIAEEIIEKPKLAELAFCLCFLERGDDTLLKDFLKELGRRFFLNNLTFPPREMIEKHPIENTRHLFMEIFTGFDLPKEPDSTFVEMIRLTKAYLEEKKKTKVAFSQLRDFFLSNPTNNSIFKSVEDSNKWLSVAIEYGIYHEEQVPHHKNPSWTVNLLSLSEDTSLFLPSGGE